MRNKLEKFLLSLLMASSVLLGLSFWLSIKFGFNIFDMQHWNELAKLQAAHIPVNINFYISIVIAFLILIMGLLVINKTQTKPKLNKIEPITNKETYAEQQTSIIQPRPQRLNLPKNFAEIMIQKHTNSQDAKKTTENKYNDIFQEIFSENGYLVKPNPTIMGLTTNLFAIGNNEVLWMGCADCDIDKLVAAENKLNSVFQETLEDIHINIKLFLLDTLKKYESNEKIFIFHTTEELKQFIHEHPADEINSAEQESFDSYSEYIDTIIQYIKNL